MGCFTRTIALAALVYRHVTPATGIWHDTALLEHALHEQMTEDLPTPREFLRGGVARDVPLDLEFAHGDGASDSVTALGREFCGDASRAVWGLRLSATSALPAAVWERGSRGSQGRCAKLVADNVRGKLSRPRCLADGHVCPGMPLAGLSRKKAAVWYTSCCKRPDSRQEDPARSSPAIRYPAVSVSVGGRGISEPPPFARLLPGRRCAAGGTPATPLDCRKCSKRRFIGVTAWQF